MLDLGSGSGILAVAAARLGAAEALGLDCDPTAVALARELALQNGLAGRVAFAEADLAALPERLPGGFDGGEGAGRPADRLLGGFDGLLANLYSDLILAHAGELARRLRPGGWFVVTGCRADRRPAIRSALEAAGLLVDRVRTRGRWDAFAGRRRHRRRHRPGSGVGLVCRRSSGLQRRGPPFVLCHKETARLQPGCRSITRVVGPTHDPGAPMRATRRSLPLALLALLTGAGTAAPVLVGWPGGLDARLAHRAVPSAVDEAEEQYQLIAGLVERGLHDLAAKEAESFLERYPDHPKAALARYRLASSLYELERFDQAGLEYAVLSSIPGFQFRAEVFFRLGQCELALGRTAEAAAALERVPSLGSDYLIAPARFFLGEARFRLGDFERAEASYLAVLDDASGGGEYERDAAYGLCWCAFRLGRYDEAVRRIEAFLGGHARDAAADELSFLLGESHLAAERPAEALAAFRAVRGEAFLESALRGAAFALAALGRHAEAAETFEEQLERFPAEKGAAHAREAALHRGIEWLRAERADRALAALADESLADDAEALYWRAQAELKTGDAEAALASAERALAGGPEGELRERLQIARGDALFDLGRESEAVGAYRESESEYALYAASIAALNEGRLGEAVEIARRVLEIYPASAYRAELWLVVGEGALAEERHQRAEAAFLAALEDQEARAIAPRALSRAGWCRFLGGNPAGAAELFERAVREFPVSPEAEEALYMLGQCHAEAGDAAAATSAWQRYVEGYPNGPRRGEALLGLARLDPAGAQGWLELALADGGDAERSAYALFELAERDAAAGQNGAAIDRYRALIERFPEDANVPAARYGLAWALHEEGRPADAAAALAPLVDESGGSAPLAPELRLSALDLAVWTHAKAGDPAGARTAYAAFRGVCQDDRRLWAAAQAVLGALEAAGDAEGSRALLDGLCADLSDPALVLEVLVESAWLALEQGRVDEAEAAARAGLELAVSREPAGSAALAEACFFVGEARYAADDFERAAALYQEAAARGSGTPAAQALYKLGFARLALEDWGGAAEAFAALVERPPGLGARRREPATCSARRASAPSSTPRPWSRSRA